MHVTDQEIFYDLDQEIDYKLGHYRLVQHVCLGTKPSTYIRLQRSHRNGTSYVFDARPKDDQKLVIELWAESIKTSEDILQETFQQTLEIFNVAAKDVVITTASNLFKKPGEEGLCDEEITEQEKGRRVLEKLKNA